MIGKSINKIKKGYEGNKILVLAIVFWCILGVSMYFAYRFEWNDSIHLPHKVEVVGNEEVREQIEIKPNDIIEQEIQIQTDAIDGISLRLGSFENEGAHAHIELHNSETGELLNSWEWNSDEGAQGEYYNFLLDNHMVGVKDKKYTLSIHADSVGEKGLFIPIVEQNHKNHVKLSVNGTELNQSVIGYNLLNGTHQGLKYFYIALLVGFLGCLVLVILLNVKHVNVEKCFICAALVLGMLYMFVLAPFSVPDEPAHFATAYAQSGKVLGEKILDENGNVLMEDNLWYNTTDITKDSYVKEVNGILHADNSGNVISTRTMLNATFGYIPQVIGLVIAKLLRLKDIQLIMMGRFMALFFYCMCMYWSIKKIPVYKEMLAIIGLFPMTLQQVVSYSYDSILIDACFVLSVLLVSKIVKPSKITAGDMGIMVCTIIVIASLKFVYLPILGLALLIPTENFGNKKKKGLMAFGTVVFSVTVLCITKLTAILNSIGTGQSTVYSSVEKISLAYCLKYPLISVGMFWRTFERSTSDYLGQMISTPLGWLNFSIPNIILITFIIVFLFSVLMEEKQGPYIKKSVRYVSGAIFLFVSVLVMVSLLLDWTWIGSKTIQGIQGRYFLPVLPVGGLAISTGFVKVKKSICPYLMMIAIYLNCWTLYFVTLQAIAK